MEQATTATSNADQIRYWAQVEGPHYVAEGDRYDILMGGFSDALLEAAELRPDERVLDIGCGNGAITIEAARRVGPAGSAIGVDVSPPMLDLARKRATASRIGQVEFRHADAQTHRFDEAGYDEVISRNGLMFFDDPDAAFANLARALSPGAASHSSPRRTWPTASGSWRRAQPRLPTSAYRKVSRPTRRGLTD